MSECPRDRLPMVKKVRTNGQVYWQCKVCYHEEEVNELEPPQWDSWDKGFDKEE